MGIAGMSWRMSPALALPSALRQIAMAAILLITLASAQPPPGATPQPESTTPKSVAPHVAASWKAGAASVIVTPDQNLWMAGYAARKKPAEGKVQELFAKALALEDHAGKRLVVVTMDLIGVPKALRQAVAERAEKEFQLPPAALLMNASHTHSGPSLRTTPPAETDQDQERARDSFAYTEKLKDQLVTVIGAALRDLQPARLTWSRARCGFAMNRRRDYSLPPEDPNSRTAPNPNGPVDQEVPALRAEAPDGTARAVLFGYACHNTCLGFYHYCGDYAGYAQEYLQAHRPGFTALFLTGCGGDQNPYPRRSGVVPGITDLELAQQHGRSLANAVEMAMTAHPRPVRGPIRALLEEVTLPYASAKREPHPYPVQVIQFGDDLVLATLGSEVVVDYSLRLKKELAGAAAVWVAAYSNDYCGYIPSLRIQKEGGYEAAAGWAEGIEESIVGKVHEMHQRLRAAAP
jgi:hypothetical protein